ncbi:MAG: hypothetical protein QXV32_04365 [Conexivisphaerales archaeon]
MLPHSVTLAVSAVDYVALFYWFMTFIALAILVASLYRSVNPQSRAAYAPQPSFFPGQSYFISVQSSDADIRIDLASDLLKGREFAQAAKYSYEAAELLLAAAAAKLGVDQAHTTLSDLANRLSSSGLLGIDVRAISYLDELKSLDNRQINEGIARRTFLIVNQLRDYFKQAPLKVQK